eukprot:4178741-Heterocapsa_arctica.AAC.1
MTQSRSGPTCWNCGGPGHASRQCSSPRKLAGTTVQPKKKTNACARCGKTGHWAAQCRAPRPVGALEE